MLKLIIADDERIIRETISHLIDWETYGIELAGLCRDGIEAYDMILDESPDIVLTDIKMPGLSGLELIERVNRTNQDIVFILLSGYGEFSYAREAMKYGVRHYLLKPCNEEQIISSIREASEECYHKRAFRQMQEQQNLLQSNLHGSIITNIINEAVGCASGPEPATELFAPYEQFMDFHHTGYELWYLYFLEETCLKECLDSLREYSGAHFPGLTIHGIYVKNTLLLFFQSCVADCGAFSGYLRELRFQGQHVELSQERQEYGSLAGLLRALLPKISRYGTIYCIHDFHPTLTCNYRQITRRVGALVSDTLTRPDHGLPDTWRELAELIGGITDPDFLKQLASNLMLRFSDTAESCSPTAVTEFLLELNREADPDHLQRMVLEKLERIFGELSAEEPRHGDLIDKIMRYVDLHLANSELTLKSIAEQYLYMNVDYVSRRFVQETGMKFSNYLTRKRIQRAKELLADCDSEKIRYVAEQVGCGNNPQYFSQIFKKYTGTTPSAYAKKMNGGK